tara:strand:- start:658 stop:1242 length:585 start_codon:yes stop_codon:yes gene_type:complete
MAKQTNTNRIDNLESELSEVKNGVTAILEYMKANTPQTPAQTNLMVTTNEPQIQAVPTIVESKLMGSVYRRGGRVYVGVFETAIGHKDYNTITETANAFDTSKSIWNQHAKDQWIPMIMNEGFCSSIDDTPEMNGIWASPAQRNLGNALRNWLKAHNLWNAEWTEGHLIQNISTLKKLAEDKGYKSKDRSTYNK